MALPHPPLGLTLALLALAPAARADGSAPLCSADDAARAAARAPCLGVPVRRVRLVGCPGSVCVSAERRRRLRSLTDFLGASLDAEALNRGLERLRDTGYFHDAYPSCRAAEDGVEVALHVCANRFVDRVDIEGQSALHASEVRKRVFLRPGSILNASPDRPDDDETVRRQQRSLERLYQREGIPLAREPEITLHATSPTTVSVGITLHEGHRHRIRAIRAAHVQAIPAAKQAPLRCPVVPPETIERVLGARAGDIITARRRRQMERTLEAWFRSIGFVSPRAQVTAQGEPLVLRAEVRTDTCWQLRVWEREAAELEAARAEPSFRFRDPVGEKPTPGASAPFHLGEFERYRALLPFAESGVFDRQEAARGISALLAQLETAGFLLADVSMEYRQRDRRPPTEPVLGTIDYYVTRNYERRIQAILTPGRRAIAADTLRQLMKTRRYDFLDATGHLVVAQLFTDLKAVRDYYRERGFYDFRYLLTGDPKDARPNRKHEDRGAWQVWSYRFRDRGFRVRKRRSELGVYLEIPLQEGPRTRVSTLEVVRADPGGGPTLLPYDEARRHMTLAPERPYGTYYLKADVRTLTRWYRDRGYHSAHVDVTCALPDGSPCDPAHVRAPRVALTLHVYEGSRITVGEVFWRGAFRTNAHVLLRDLPRAGAPYSRSALSEATRKLRNLGIFNAVRVDTIGLDETPPRDPVALVVTVEETPARFLDLAAGFRNIHRANLGTVPSLVGSLIGQSVAAADRGTLGHAHALNLTIPDILLVAESEYLDSNAFGRGDEFHAPLEYGFSTRMPLRLLRLTPSYAFPRFLDSDLRLELSARAVFEDRVTYIKDFQEFSAATTTSVPVLPKMVVAAQVEAGAVRFQEADAEPHLPFWEGPTAQPGETGAEACTRTGACYDGFVRASLRWRWDQQDNPLHPTRGFALGTSLSVIRSTELDGGQTTFRDFVKWEASARFAARLPLGMILAGMIHYGGSDADETHPLPTKDRFTLGGNNGMRGFADDAVGRYDRSGHLLKPPEGSRLDVGGNVVVNGSLELRVPILESAGLWLGLFTDMGALAAKHAELYPNSLRASVGVGLRYLLGDQIPFRLDWGLVLGPRCARYWLDDAAQPEDRYACRTTEDPSTLHFGFLYPF